MKKVILSSFLFFFISSVLYSQSKLPECKPTDKVLYHNCYGKKIYGRNGEYYEAEFKNNLPIGEVKFSFGDKYIGGWNDKGPHGKGKYYYKEGYIYDGEYKNGKRNGQGIFTNPNGEKYVGEFKDGKNHGQGTYTFPDGGKYVGEYKNDMRDGRGKFTTSDGSTLSGEFKEGKFIK
jgi:hypothetical protein